MHTHNLTDWQHPHSFGQEHKKTGEMRTIIVIVITATMMVIEIFAGLRYGSMALLADGLHMASHAAALGISAFAYIYARRLAHNTEFNFGTGKINALGGFAGAILLAVFAVLMVWESIGRLLDPVEIFFNQAIFVAVLGLLVNGVSVFILGVDDHDHDHSADEKKPTHHHDHNLRSAYLHVLADALTSILAIVALLTAKYLGLIWMDPVVGLVGAAVVAWWSIGLLSSTSSVLLDRQGPQAMRQSIKEQIEIDNDSQVTDLHLWSIAPNLYAVIISLVADKPARPDDYKARLSRNLNLAHVSIEIQQCTGHHRH